MTPGTFSADQWLNNNKNNTAANDSGGGSSNNNDKKKEEEENNSHTYSLSSFTDCKLHITFRYFHRRCFTFDVHNKSRDCVCYLEDMKLHAVEIKQNDKTFNSPQNIRFMTYQ